jgi:hypothetical protein
MGVVALIIATGCYVVTAADLAYRRNWPMCLVFAAYAAANLGLIWATYRTK